MKGMMIMVYKSVSEAVSERILQLCRDKNITINKLATLSAVTQSTVNDIVSKKSKNIGIVTIKKLCDGLQISIVDFFDDEIFKELEQEIY